jgi:TorA maturation chaperone TorD
MVTEPYLPEATAEDAAREYLYSFLAAVLGGPYTEGWDRALDPRSRELALFASELLDEHPEADAPPDGLGAAPREAPAFARLVRELAAPPGDLRAEYDRVFGLVVPRECPPYETEYYPTAETFARSQQMADVAGFYRAFGVEPSRRSPERPDYLGLELEFMALLLLKTRLASTDTRPGEDAAERAEICELARRAFFRDHLAWWVPSFAAGLRRKAGSGCYLALADALSQWIPSECRRQGIPSVLRPARPHLIERPEFQSGCAGCPSVP